MINAWELRPIQSLVASAFFHYKHVMLMLPRQEGKTELEDTEAIIDEVVNAILFEISETYDNE